MSDDTHDPLSTGSDYPQDTELSPEEEPVVTGTLFLSMLLLIGILGAWFVIYFTMLDRL